jgi:hypothetical protein
MNKIKEKAVKTGYAFSHLIESYSTLLAQKANLSKVASWILYTSVSQPPGRGPVPGPGISYTGPSSHRKKNLPGRGLTKVENHCCILIKGRIEETVVSVNCGG